MVELQYSVWRKNKFYLEYKTPRINYAKITQRSRLQNIPNKLSFEELTLYISKQYFLLNRKKYLNYQPGLLRFQLLLKRQLLTHNNLQRILSSYFKIPIQIKTFQKKFHTLSSEQRTYLAGSMNCLGRDALLGIKVADVNNQIKIIFGPLSYDDYLKHLPNTPVYQVIINFLQLYVAPLFEYTIQILLKTEEKPITILKRNGGIFLGWNSWLAKNGSKIH